MKTLLFVAKSKWSADKSSEVITKASESLKETPEGIEVKEVYVMPGKCEVIQIIEAEDEESILKLHTPVMDILECDWTPAMSFENAMKSMSE